MLCNHCQHWQIQVFLFWNFWIFLKNIFHPWFVESPDAKPVESWKGDCMVEGYKRVWVIFFFSGSVPWIFPHSPPSSIEGKTDVLSPGYTGGTKPAITEVEESESGLWSQKNKGHQRGCNVKWYKCFPCGLVFCSQHPSLVLTWSMSTSALRHISFSSSYIFLRSFPVWIILATFLLSRWKITAPSIANISKCFCFSSWRYWHTLGYSARIITSRRFIKPCSDIGLIRSCIWMVLFFPYHLLSMCYT